MTHEPADLPRGTAGKQPLSGVREAPDALGFEGCSVRLSRAPDSVEAADWAALDAADRAACLRLATPALRARRAHGRALLRSALAERLQVDARALAFQEGVHGRPRLDPRAAKTFPGLDFSLSYGGGVVACAVAPHGRIGVDLEPPPADAALRDLLHRATSADERRWLERRYGRARARDFAAIWALKEAWGKARGEGLGLPFDRVTLRPDRAAGVCADLVGARDDEGDWIFYHRSLPGGQQLALAWRPAAPLAEGCSPFLISGVDPRPAGNRMD